jgi:hypothetical protein
MTVFGAIISRLTPNLKLSCAALAEAELNRAILVLLFG